MKILLLKKRKIIAYIFIFLAIIIYISLSIILKTTVCITTELTSNSEVSTTFLENVKNLAKSEEKIAYLTFDDGPTVSVTPKILDILKDENIKATFFVIGKNVDAHPEIVKRAYEEGHYIANHGYDHNNTNLYKSPESFMEEVQKTDLAIGNAIGINNYCAKVFRFPNGYMSPTNKAKKKEAVALLEANNYTYIDWNCLNNDSVQKCTNEQLLASLKKTSKNKNTLVILMHDTKFVNDSSQVLKASIDYLRSEGYEFQNFYNLLNLNIE